MRLFVNVGMYGENWGREDADACISRVKCMLEGQYVEICPLKGVVIRTYWNACIGKPGNFQERWLRLWLAASAGWQGHG